jgi:hypothetical protein
LQLNPEPTAQQQQVLVFLAQGKSINAAAAAAGIHRNTIANWRRSSETFRHHWHIMQYEQAMHWRDELQSIAQIAVDAVLKTLTDEKTPPTVRLRAALAVLDKVTAVPPSQPDWKRSRTTHNLAQERQETAAGPLAQEPAAPAQSAQSCTTAVTDPFEDPLHVNDDGLDDLLKQMCSPPRMHNPAQGLP